MSDVSYVRDLTLSQRLYLPPSQKQDTHKGKSCDKE